MNQNEKILLALTADSSEFDRVIDKVEKKTLNVLNSINDPKKVPKFDKLSKNFAKEFAKVHNIAVAESEKLEEVIADALNINTGGKISRGDLRAIREATAAFTAAVREREKATRKSQEILAREEMAAITKVDKRKRSQQELYAKDATKEIDDLATRERYLQELYAKDVVKEMLEASKLKRHLQEIHAKDAARDIEKLHALEKRMSSNYRKSRNAIIRELAKNKENLNRAEHAAELRRLHKLSSVELNNIRRANDERARQKASTTTSSTSGTSTDPTKNRDLLSSVGIVAKYGAISQALMLVQSSIRGIVTESLNYNQTIYKNMAVLNASREDAILLTNTTRALAVQYGTASEEISEAMLTIGRAGVDGISELQQSTKVLSELALITGDTMGDGAAAISTMLSVYPRLTHEVTVLGDKMAIVANATRLGLKDFSTIANYALTTAESIGLSAEAYLALSGAMSKVGLNASTIGTSIRRLKKFTDSSSAAMSAFYRTIGITQEEFRGMLANTESSTGALVAFSQKLGELSKDKEKYAAATRNLNIQEKATADAFAAIGKNSYLTTMLLEMTAATKESKILAKQAELYSKGINSVIARVRNAVTELGNETVTSALSVVFGDASDISGDIDTLVYVIKLLVKETAVLGVAFLAFGVKARLAAAGVSITTLSLSNMTKGVHRASSALGGFVKKNPIILIATVAMAAYAAATTTATDAHQDLIDMVESSSSAVKDLGEHQLRLANTVFLEKQAALQEKVNNLLKEQKGLMNHTTRINLPLTGKALLENKATIEDINKQLKKNRELMGSITKESRKFSDNPLPFVPSAKDLAIMAETNVLMLGINDSVAKSIIAYAKLTAEKQKAKTLVEEEGKVANNEEAIIVAKNKLAKASANLLKSKFQIEQDLIGVQQQYAASVLKTKELIKGVVDFEARSLAIGEQKKVILSKIADLSAALNKATLGMSADEVKAYKETEAYKLIFIEQQKTLTELQENTTEELENSNASLTYFNSLSVDAIKQLTSMTDMATSFAHGMAKAADRLAMLKGSIGSGEFNVRIAERDVKAAEVNTGNEKSRLVAETEIMNTLTSQSEIKAQQVVIDTQTQAFLVATLEQENAMVSLEEAKVALKTETLTTSHEEALVALELANTMGDVVGKSQRRLEQGLAATKILKENLRFAKEEASITPNKTNNLKVKKAELAIEKNKKKIKEAQYDIEHKITKESKKGAADARAALKAKKDGLTILSLEADINAANATLAFDQMGIVASEFVVQEQITALAINRAEIARLAYDQAVAEHGLNNSNLMIKKEVLKLELKSIRADSKKWKEINKNLTDFHKKMNATGASFADSLLQGDIKGAFKGLLQDIYSVFTRPLKDMFSNLFGKTMTSLVGGFYDTMMTGSAKAATQMVTDATVTGQANALSGVAGQSAGDPYTAFGRMAAMAAIMAALGFAVSGAGGGGSKGISKEDYQKSIGAVDSPESESVSNLLSTLNFTATRDLEYSRGIFENLSALVKSSDRAAVLLTSSASFNGIESSSTGGFAGFSSKDVKTLFTGLELQAVNMKNIIANTVSTVRTDKSSWWGLSSSSSVSTTRKSIDSGTMKAISDAYSHGAKAIQGAAELLGVTNAKDIIAGFKGAMHNLNFEGKSQEEIAKLIEGAISSDLDAMASMIAPYIGEYQRAGEGMLETMGRVAYEMEAIDAAFKLMGEGFPEFGEEAVALSQAFLTASGGLDNALSNINGYLDNFFTDAEKQARLAKKLADSTGLFSTEEGFKNRVDTLRREERMAELAALLANQEAYRKYFDYLKKIADEAGDAIEDSINGMLDFAMRAAELEGTAWGLSNPNATNVEKADRKLYDAQVAERYILSFYDMLGVTAENFQDEYLKARSTLDEEGLEAWEKAAAAIGKTVDAELALTNARKAAEEALKTQRKTHEDLAYKAKNISDPLTGEDHLKRTHEKNLALEQLAKDHYGMLELDAKNFYDKYEENYLNGMSAEEQKMWAELIANTEKVLASEKALSDFREKEAERLKKEAEDAFKLTQSKLSLSERGDQISNPLEGDALLERSLQYAKIAQKEIADFYGMSHVTTKNFYEEYAKVRESLSSDELKIWEAHAKALEDVITAEKSLDDARKESAETAKQAAKEEAERIKDFYENINGIIHEAMTGSLSYLNMMEKADYLGSEASKRFSNGDTQGYIDLLGEQLEQEKKMARTKEEYAVEFDTYVNRLLSEEAPEVNDSETLVGILAQAVRIEDAIVASGYQAPLGASFRGV